MSTHPQTCKLHFIRHAPVVKRSGHVPPADPPILDKIFDVAPLCDKLPVDAEWHVSPLRRAIQTAELLTARLTPRRVETAPELVEMDHGSWHDRPVAEVWDEIRHGRLHNWTFLPADHVPPNGESFTMLAERVHGWMQRIETGFDPAPKIIVTHAGVIRAAMAVALRAPLDQVVGVPVPHFGIMTLALMDPADAGAEGGCWLFESLSDPGIIPGGIRSG